MSRTDPEEDGDEEVARAFAEYLALAELGEDVDVARFVAGQPAALRPELEARIRGLHAMARHLELATDLRAGDLVGEYRLLEQIGAGGMGVVWRARHVTFDREVALKFLFDEAGLAGGTYEQFRREARAACRVNHPGIVTLFDVGEREGVPYLVQELVHPPRTLERELAERARLASVPREHDAWVAHYFQGAADALRVAHEKGVIHGDVKPANLLVTAEGAAKVVDLGLARIEGDLDPAEPQRTRGSLPYVAPEQLASRNRRPSEAADVFALGASLFEALTFRRLRPGSEREAVRAEIRAALAEDPRTARKRVPRDLALVCKKAIQPDPAQRYRSMAEFADDLGRYLEHEPVEASDAPALRRGWLLCRRHPAVAVGLTLGLFLLVSETVIVVLLAAGRAQTRRAEEAGTLLIGLLDRNTLIDAAQRDLQLERAERAARELGDGEPGMRAALSLAIGEIRMLQGQAKLALPGLRDAHEHAQHAPDDTHWSWLRPWIALRLATCLRALDRIDEAEDCIRATVARLAPELGAQQPASSSLTAEYALILVRRADLEGLADFRADFGEPREHIKSCARRMHDALGPRALATLEARAALGLCRALEGELSAGARELEEVVGIAEGSEESKHVRLIEVRGELARIYSELGRHGDAVRELEIVHARLAKALGDADPRAVRAQIALGWGGLRARDLAGALQSFAGALELTGPDARLARADARRGRDLVRARRAILRLGSGSEEQVLPELAEVAADMQAARAELDLSQLAEAELWLETTLDLVHTCCMARDIDRALALLAELEGFQVRRDAEHDAQLARLRAAVLAQAGDDAGELRARESAVELAERCADTRPELALTARCELARVLVLAQREEEAHAAADEGRARLERMELATPVREAWTALLASALVADPSERRALLESSVSEMPVDRSGRGPDRLADAARWLVAAARVEGADPAAEVDLRLALHVQADGLRPDDRAGALVCDGLLFRKK